MSRSRRKTPIFGHTTSHSEKQDKKHWHRAFRRASRQSPDVGEFTHYREHSNPWSMSKDGRYYWREVSAKDMRK